VGETSGEDGILGAVLLLVAGIDFERDLPALPVVALGVSTAGATVFTPLRTSKLSNE
jgi:hypothetical protein